MLQNVFKLLALSVRVQFLLCGVKVLLGLNCRLSSLTVVVWLFRVKNSYQI